MMHLLTKNKKTALRYSYYFFPVLVLTIAGIGNTLYLTFSHYKNYTDISYASFCAISEAINCDTVSQSAWSIFFNIPVALWGLIGYFLFLVFLVVVRRNDEKNKPLWSILFVLAFLYSLSALFFGYISAIKIKSYCILCFFSYLISFGLLLYSWIIRRRFSCDSLYMDIKQSLPLIKSNRFLIYSLVSLFFIICCIKIFLPHYWKYQFPEPASSIQNGITNSGHPWIGATNPTLTIEEFTDYQCFQCAKMHYYLRQLVAENPQKIRLIHRNYPMDHEVNPYVVPEPFHIGSARLAMLSIAAQNQNKFWQVNDALFKVIQNKKTEINMQEIAELAQADLTDLRTTIYTKETIKKLETDIRDGLRHKITGTPAYIINDEVYLGSIPEIIFQYMDK
jgi:protein-disulfide isomerase/uncharacterized membrane protein